MTQIYILIPPTPKSSHLAHASDLWLRNPSHVGSGYSLFCCTITIQMLTSCFKYTYMFYNVSIFSSCRGMHCIFLYFQTLPSTSFQPGLTFHVNLLPFSSQIEGWDIHQHNVSKGTELPQHLTCKTIMIRITLCNSVNA